jgi:dihydroorotase
MNIDQTVALPESITITRPDDWHLHLRDDAAMRAVLPHTASRFARAIVMPNLRPPITTTALAVSYRQRILSGLPAGMVFDPLMTLYLTDNTRVEEIKLARESGVVYALKYYPAGPTTNSDSGVTAIEKCYPVLAAMERYDLPLLVHGEVTGSDVDVFDREAMFIDQILRPLVARFPNLKIVMEHITTQEAVEFVMQAPVTIAATLTPQHLMLNRNAIFNGGVRPHNYCLPILKRESHRRALVAAAISGMPKFFLGTDSAPHAQHTKENDCGCAGMYTAHAGIELYAELFAAEGALSKLEGFASFFGADFYGLPRNTQKITLKRQAWTVPDVYPFGEHTLVPMRARENIQWQLIASQT